MSPLTKLEAPVLMAAIQRAHRQVRIEIVAACNSQSFEQLCGEATVTSSDTLYAIDHLAEESLLKSLAVEVASLQPVVVLGEGLPEDGVVLPSERDRGAARWQLLVDPLDGTRGIMFQKRSAWILTGAAPISASPATLADINLAVQTEVPLLKQYLCDELCAIRGQGAQAARVNRMDAKSHGFDLQPSRSDQVAHGYGTVCSFFSGGRDLLGKIADELSARLLAGHQPGEARIFEDQYAATAGQLAGLAQGQDRFVADLRPLLADALALRNQPLGHCCHPYDLCTKLIAEQAGVILTSLDGKPQDAPFDSMANVAWVGYANLGIRKQVEPALQSVLRELGLL